MRPLTTHRSTRAACGGDHCDHGAGAGDPLLPFARPRARRRGRLRGRGDAAGLLGQHREPARGGTSGSRVGAGDGLALRRRRRDAHLRQPRGDARPRSRATAAGANSGTRACPTPASGNARTARARPSAWAANARRAWRRHPPRPNHRTQAGSAARGAAATPDRASASICRPTFPTGARADGAAARCTTAPRGACANATPPPTRWPQACDLGHPCVDGSRCAEGWCVPERPAPGCWLQTDCPGGRCRFGSCLAGGA